MDLIEFDVPSDSESDGNASTASSGTDVSFAEFSPPKESRANFYISFRILFSERQRTRITGSMRWSAVKWCRTTMTSTFWRRPEKTPTGPSIPSSDLPTTGTASSAKIPPTTPCTAFVSAAFRFVPTIYFHYFHSTFLTRRRVNKNFHTKTTERRNMSKRVQTSFCFPFCDVTARLLMILFSFLFRWLLKKKKLKVENWNWKFFSTFNFFR